MEAFLEDLKETVLPGVWSKGVALSRNTKSVERISPESETQEIKLKIQTDERLLAFQVTLWPKDQDSYCNCGSKIEPCHHVVAVALALSQNRVQSKNDAELKSSTHLAYEWIYIDGNPPSIELKRYLVDKGERTELRTSLTSLLGGIQSGRTDSPLPRASATDLKLDEYFFKPLSTLPPFLKALEELPEIPVIGHPTLKALKVKARIERPRLTLTDHGEKSILITPDFFEKGLTLKGGLSLRGNLLSPSQNPHPVQTRALHPNEFEEFILKTLPYLSEHYEILEQTTRLPKKVSLEPKLTLVMIPSSEGSVSITARVEYPETKRNEILERNLKHEGELIKEARERFELKVDQPQTLSTKDALSFRQKLEGSPFQSEFDTHLSLNIERATGLTLEAALKEKDTLLRLLEMKEKSVEPDSRVLSLLKSLPNAPDSKTEDYSAEISPLVREILRPYQREGVNWLKEKAEKLGGAILADDMGLGKTLQTLALLKKPALVVAPTSLLSNWKQEAARFRPDLKVQIYHGNNRSFDESADITLTTYSLLRLEPEQFVNRKWDTVVLDEAHLIRNPDTQAAVVSSKLHSNFRLALTGTPIQNHPRDLWSLFLFIAPGLFPTVADLTPKLLVPFVLRRTKAQVLPELPPKTYIEHEIELSVDEKNLYDALFAAAKTEILEKLSESETLSPFTFFELLLRARQVCNHAALIDPSRIKMNSSKTEAIFEQIQDLIEAGHSILLYSQWTGYLDILENILKGKVPLYRLDGQTKNRGDVVESFQNDETPSVFLLSLQAGGVGLNLVRASHVIFCDLWWNPFVELQAEDRAYRLGQNKPVTIHRMFVKNSIEEQIRALQKAKLAQGEAVFQAQDFNILLKPSLS